MYHQVIGQRKYLATKVSFYAISICIVFAINRLIVCSAIAQILLSRLYGIFSRSGESDSIFSIYFIFTEQYLILPENIKALKVFVLIISPSDTLWGVARARLPNNRCAQPSLLCFQSSAWVSLCMATTAEIEEISGYPHGLCNVN